ESPITSIGRDQRAGVVNDAAHAERRGRAARRGRRPDAKRWRAALSSASVKGPCSASHSATAASPSRILSASLAASVIHAETLTPRRAASASTCAWTSGAIVIASFGEGFPVGIRELYYHGMIPAIVF